MFWTTLISVLVATASSGIALGVALGLTGLILLQFFNYGSTYLALDTIWGIFNSFTLSAVPLFILLGEILLKSGISERAYAAFTPIFARIPGGLLHSNVAVCTLFGAVSGSSLSTAAAIGSVAYPELSKRGYDKETVVGSLAGAGTLGLLIPPSLSLLIFGALTETSIGRLFAAGILPGLMVSALFMCFIFFLCVRNPSLAPKDTTTYTMSFILQGLLRIWPILMLILAIMGSIMFGIATPTEAAAIGVGAAIFISFIWGDMTVNTLMVSIYKSALLFASIGFIVLGAAILSQSVSILGVPQTILEAAINSGLDRYGIFVLIILIYVLFGCVFDGLSLMVMTLPIVFPLLTGLGFDPIWIGVMITILIEIGQVTPPVGLNLSVLTTITGGEISLGRTAIATVPYWLILILAIGLITLVPEIVLLLPDAIF
ncbi:TRAP transporter large permease [Grimontia sp. NTOU-MAR1]|uniref:TRAP transporter large permease n=1 Tax=Grimontia sp. NTOU-MAR1 TaxID=3111011 RepID=UPI002DB62B22|nr:TRAP transporter large permease subunit [Grimontia sp. NTOU-MAR1]WRW00773.1 TRAP transporter large permease subunit [Grimontia sp. NTOU-MAR1]